MPAFRIQRVALRTPDGPKLVFFFLLGQVSSKHTEITPFARWPAARFFFFYPFVPHVATPAKPSPRKNRARNRAGEKIAVVLLPGCPGTCQGLSGTPREGPGTETDVTPSPGSENPNSESWPGQPEEDP